MKASELFEDKWWKFGDTITLYHGTSSQLLDKIRKEGLTPPDNPIEYAFEVLKDYEDQIRKDDTKIRQLIKEKITGYRSYGGKYTKAIYLLTDKDRAKQYAEAYSEHGGEIAYDVFFILKTYRGIDSPRWHKSSPIVVEVEIPYDWAKMAGGRDMKEIYHRAVNRGYDTPEKLDKLIGSFEIRVERNIPKSMIKNIIEVKDTNENI